MKVLSNLLFQLVLLLPLTAAQEEGENNPTTSFRWDDGETCPQLTDWGMDCTADSDCQSGICSTSCSSYDLNPLTSTSCMCPCTEDQPGPCCCGCVTNGGTQVDGMAAVTTCPDYLEATDSNPDGTGWARGDVSIVCAVVAVLNDTAPCDSSGLGEPPLDSIPCDFTCDARLGLLDNELVVPEGVEYVVNYTGHNDGAQKLFGDMCETADECQSGICGTGCDCPSKLLATCSCQVPCNFPTKCCGGCFIDQDPIESTCPMANDNATVSFATFDGPTPWIADDSADPSYNLCMLYMCTMDGVEAPASCDRFLDAMPEKRASSLLQ